MVETTWWGYLLYGLFTGIGIETAKIIHEIYIAPILKKRAEQLNETIKETNGKIKKGVDKFDLSKM